VTAAPRRGSTWTTDEPARPATVTADTTVNVNTATQKVAQLEGISIPTPFTGRENSAFIAGLAYDSAKDPDHCGTLTLNQAGTRGAAKTTCW
jgi:type IV pilus assembly protein PilY1